MKLSPEGHLLNLLVEPVVQIMILFTTISLLAYDSVKQIYFRQLKDLDNEVCRRAENYAAYDLTNPPKNNRRRTHRKSNKREVANETE